MSIDIIVKLGGHQSFTEFGNSFDIPKIDITKDKYILLKKILLISYNNKIFHIGTPYLTNILAYAKVLKQNIIKSKLIIFKMKSKKGYRRKKGYKSLYTKLFFVGLNRIYGA